MKPKDFLKNSLEYQERSKDGLTEKDILYILKDYEKVNKDKLYNIQLLSILASNKK